MCLAIPAVVKTIKCNVAEIEIMNIKKEVDISLVPEVKVGDFVIVHAGFAIQIIDKQEALVTQRYWEEYLTGYSQEEIEEEIH